MNGSDALQLMHAVHPRVAVPVHYEGWSHFSEPPALLEREMARLGPTDDNPVRWLEPGVPREM